MEKKKLNEFQHFMNFVDKFVRVVCIIMMLCLFLCVLMQVITRYVLSKPFPWTEEVARYLLVWLCFLGASHIANKSSYISVTYFLDKMPTKLRTAVCVINKLLMLICIAYFMFASLRLYLTINVSELSPASSIPMIIPRSALFIGPFITLFQMLSSGGLKLVDGEEEKVELEQI